MIGVPSLDLLAFPVRFTDRAHRRRHRRPAGRAVLRLLPPGARRRAAASPSPRSARPTTSRPSCWRPATTLLVVGDGALRYREAFAAWSRVEIADHGLRPPVGARRWCSWPTPRRCASSWCSPGSVTPLYLRKPDAEINWSTRRRPGPTWRVRWPPSRRLPTGPRRRRHHADAAAPPARRAAHRAARCTRGRGRSALFLAELALPRQRALPRGPVGGHGRRLRRADDRRRRRPRHHRRRRPRPAPHGASAPGCCSRWPRRGRDHGRRPRSPSRCGCPTRGAQALYRRFGFAPAGVRKAYYVDNRRGRPGHVGPRHRRPRARRPASTAHSPAAVPRARTVRRTRPAA